VRPWVGASCCLTVVMTASESLLQEMFDEFALRKLVHAYCRAVDRGDGEISTGSVDELVQTLEASRPHIRPMQHNVTTMSFVIDGGRYLDKYEKRDDAWKIVERTIVTDWAHVNDPSAVDLSHPITRGTLKGSPGADDPSHQFFSLFTR
jgi:hypothetical protein